MEEIRRGHGKLDLRRTGSRIARAIKEDYPAMQGMMLGDAPPFDWAMAQRQRAEDALNRREN